MRVHFYISVAAFTLQQESWVQVARTKYPPKLKIVTISSLQKKSVDLVLEDRGLLTPEHWEEGILWLPGLRPW